MPITIKKKYNNRQQKESKSLFEPRIILETPCKCVLGMDDIPGGLSNLHESDPSHHMQVVPDTRRAVERLNSFYEARAAPLLSETWRIEVRRKGECHPGSQIQTP